MASQYFSCSTSFAARRMASSARRASSSGSRGGSGGGGLGAGPAPPGPAGLRGRLRPRPSQALLVVGPLPRVAQHVVRLAQADEHGLELVAQVPERGAVVHVRVEALREAEVGVLHLGLADGAREAEDLEVVARLEPVPRLEDLAAPLRRLLVGGLGTRGRGGRRGSGRRRRGRRRRARGRGRRAARAGAASRGRSPRAGRRRLAGRRGATNSTTPVESRPSRLLCVRSAGSGIICTISRALVTPSTRESTKPSAGDSVSFWKRSSGSVGEREHPVHVAERVAHHVRVADGLDRLEDQLARRELRA